MASFDIESLFTNIPLQQTIDICVQNLFKDRTYVDDMLKDSFRDLLTRTMSESSILFDQEFYKQHDGVAMGSSLGSTLANGFLYYHENFGFKIVLLNSNLLSIEGTLIIYSYFFTGNITSKYSEITQIVNIKTFQIHF